MSADNAGQEGAGACVRRISAGGLGEVGGQRRRRHQLGDLVAEEVVGDEPTGGDGCLFARGALRRHHHVRAGHDAQPHLARGLAGEQRDPAGASVRQRAAERGQRLHELAARRVDLADAVERLGVHAVQPRLLERRAPARTA